MQKSMAVRQKIDLEAMTVDELWQLHEELSSFLSVRMTHEKHELERKLAQLRREEQAGSLTESFAVREPQGRRAYPRVLQKYQNPENPAETWSGRGKQPRWMAAALSAGRRIDDMVIAHGHEVTEES